PHWPDLHLLGAPRHGAGRKPGAQARPRAHSARRRARRAGQPRAIPARRHAAAATARSRVLQAGGAVIECGACGLPLVPGEAEEADKWRTADGGRYFCQASDDGMHHAVQALPDPRVGREGLTFVVSVASINAAPGAPLLASYWARARPGEGLSAWRER